MIGSALLYWLVIQPISRLPYPLLYAVSDFFFVVLYYVVPYRKKVVLKNLSMAFPEKSDEERKRICRAFYRHFCDLVLESLKNFSIREKDAHARMVNLNPEVMDAYAEQGRSVMLCGGHYGNWELWAVASPGQLQHKLLGIYKRLSNAYFDRKMRETRSRYGLELVSTRQTGEYLRAHPNELNATVFAIDQSPSNPQKAVWIDFLGLDTCAYLGAEKYARDFDRPVLFGHVEKVRRGYYTVRYEVVCDRPKETRHGEITQLLHRILEADIRRQPEYWLWTHKRWKHSRGQGSGVSDQG